MCNSTHARVCVCVRACVRAPTTTTIASQVKHKPNREPAFGWHGMVCELLGDRAAWQRLKQLYGSKKCEWEKCNRVPARRGFLMRVFAPTSRSPVRAPGQLSPQQQMVVRLRGDERIDELRRLRRAVPRLEERVQQSVAEAVEARALAARQTSLYEEICRDANVIRLRAQLATVKRQTKSRIEAEAARAHVADSVADATQRQLVLAMRLAKGVSERHTKIIANITLRANDRLEALEAQLRVSKQEHAGEIEALRQEHASELMAAHAATEAWKERAEELEVELAAEKQDNVALMSELEEVQASAAVREEELRAKVARTEAAVEEARATTREQFIELYAKEWKETAGAESPNKRCMFARYVSARKIGAIESLPRPDAISGGRGSKGKGSYWGRLTAAQIGSAEASNRTNSRRQQQLNTQVLDLYSIPMSIPNM